MNEKIEVGGAPVVFSTAKPAPYNPLNRPDISYKKPIIALVIYIAIMAVIFIMPWNMFLEKWIVIIIMSILYFMIISKKAVIWVIHLYQNKASDKTRLRCVFEPSCSEYMILAIEKYGFMKGVFKGVKRLLRCHPPNGGKDYP